MAIDLINLYITDGVHRELAEEELQRRKSILFKAQKLEYIKQELLSLNLLQKKNISKRTKLHHVLGVGSELGLGFKIDMFKENNEYIAKAGQLIFSAYELTSEILQELKIISPVGYTFTYHGTNKFYRSSNLVINPQEDLTFEVHRNALTVRLKQSSIKSKLEAQNTAFRTDWINEHYKGFIAPYEEAQEKSTTGWQVNWGIASEAFERHWEMLQHSLEHPTGADYGSIGDRWQLYLKSSGNDPYYTGPDTALSQVKNANASMISNSETVLNTLEAVLKIINTKVDSQEAAEELTAKYSQAFKAKSTTTYKISKAIWDTLEQDVQEELISIFGGATIKKNVVLFG